MGRRFVVVAAGQAGIEAAEAEANPSSTILALPSSADPDAGKSLMQLKQERAEEERQKKRKADGQAGDGDEQRGQKKTRQQDGGGDDDKAKDFGGVTEAEMGAFDALLFSSRPLRARLFSLVGARTREGARATAVDSRRPGASAGHARLARDSARVASLSLGGLRARSWVGRRRRRTRSQGGVRLCCSTHDGRGRSLCAFARRSSFISSAEEDQRLCLTSQRTRH